MVTRILENTQIFVSTCGYQINNSVFSCDPISDTLGEKDANIDAVNNIERWIIYKKNNDTFWNKFEFYLDSLLSFIFLINIIYLD